MGQADSHPSTARVIADLSDHHPQRTITIANQLVEDQCPLEIIDYLTYLPQNKDAQTLFTIHFRLMDENSYEVVRETLETAVDFFSRLKDTPGAEDACQTMIYLLNFYHADTISDIIP